MARKSRMGVLKRQRELRKQEKAAIKRERKASRTPQETLEASADDLASYGFEDAEPEEAESDEG